MRRHLATASYFRNFIFGVEDSLVSTVGLLSGIAIANATKETILLTGIVLIFVEGFSMAAGVFLSEESTEEFQHGKDTPKRNFLEAVVMFFSYFISGFIPLFAYIIWPVVTALFYSIIFSLIALFILGVIGARLSHTSIIKSGVRMITIGGLAILLGAFAGSFVTSL